MRSLPPHLFLLQESPDLPLIICPFGRSGRCALPSPGPPHNLNPVIWRRVFFKWLPPRSTGPRFITKKDTDTSSSGVTGVSCHRAARGQSRVSPSRCIYLSSVTHLLWVGWESLGRTKLVYVHLFGSILKKWVAGRFFF
jgi:hypothetical protein